MATGQDRQAVRRTSKGKHGVRHDLQPVVRDVLGPRPRRSQGGGAEARCRLGHSSGAGATTVTELAGA